MFRNLSISYLCSTPILPFDIQLFVYNSSVLFQSSKMKKNSSLRQEGESLGKITLFTSPNFQGDQHTFGDTVTKINESPWKGKSIGSLIIQGNPWMLYTEDGMKVSIFD